MVFKHPRERKIFLWRLHTNSLPTNNNLFQKHVFKSPNCPICHTKVETTIHMTWNCKSVSDVWADSNLATHNWQCVMADIAQLWSFFLKRMTKSDLALAAMIMHNIWK